MRLLSKCLAMWVILLILSQLVLNVSAQKIYSLDSGQVRTEALEVGETAEVEVEVISGNSIDLYLVPDVEFLKDMTLSGNFTYVEKYSATNVTRFNFTFTPEDDEVRYYVVLKNPNVNMTDDNNGADEASTPVEDTKVAVSVIYPEIQGRALAFGILSTVFVIFLYTYIFIVIRSKHIKENL